jgi:hypothetical protein
LADSSEGNNSKMKMKKRNGNGIGIGIGFDSTVGSGRTVVVWLDLCCDFTSQNQNSLHVRQEIAAHAKGEKSID